MIKMLRLLHAFSRVNFTFTHVRHQNCITCENLQPHAQLLLQTVIGGILIVINNFVKLMPQNS